MAEESTSRVGVSWLQVAASALAAVSSAVLLSTLGVAGTVIGAALGSVVATISTALYSRTLDVSRQQVAAQATALRRVTRARTELDEVVAARRRGEVVSDTAVTRAGQELDEAEEVLAAAPDSTPDETEDADEVGDVDEAERAARHGTGTGTGTVTRAGTAGWRAQLSWRRLALVAGAVFLVAMATITAFELTTGRAVSTYTGGSERDTGSTVPGLGDARDRDRAPTDAPTSEDPAGDPAGSESPSEDATEDPTGSADPTGDPSDVPSDDPSPSVTSTPSPSPDEPSSDPSSPPAG